jgi:hypothetical protein
VEKRKRKGEKKGKKRKDVGNKGTKRGVKR